MSQPAVNFETARAPAALPGFVERLAHALPGLAFAAVVAVAATFLSERFKLSAMLFALLLGMAFHFVAMDARCRPGIEMASRLVLRTGVALLGLRIALSDALGLGWAAIAMGAAGIALTMALGIALARVLRLGDRFGVLSGGAVSICGASAALAISSVLPRDSTSDRNAGFVVVAVTGLSTIAMFAYPVIARLFGLDDHAAGLFFGASIHDVAQVVGAGYAVSPDAGDVATVMKLVRVAMLLPVCFVIGVVLRMRGGTAMRKTPVLPLFVVAFALLVVAGSSGHIAPSVVRLGGEVSNWFLVVAMAAIGMKTSLRALAQVGAKAMLAVVLETIFLAALALALLAATGHAPAL